MLQRPSASFLFVSSFTLATGVVSSAAFVGCGGGSGDGGPSADGGAGSRDASAEGDGGAPGDAGDSGTTTSDAGDGRTPVHDAGDSGPEAGDAGDAGDGGALASEGAACARLTTTTALLSSPLPTSDTYTDPASDGAYVYIGGTSSLYRVASSGGALETVTSRYLSGYNSLAASTGTVAWEYPAAGTQPAGLTVRNATGSHDVAPTGGATIQQGFVVDAQGDVFFGVTLGDSTTQFQWWHPGTGAVTAMTGVGTPQSGASLYFANGGQLFWTGQGPGGSGLYATDITTGAIHPLDAPQDELGGILGVDATHLYGTGSICPQSACPFSVWAAPRDGGAPAITYQSTTSYWTNGLTADASGLYWVDWTTSALYHAAFGGSGAATSIATLDGGVVPSHFALDDCNVYWTNANGTGATQQVMAAPK